MSFNTQSGKVVCGQAVVKDVSAEWTDDMKAESFKLSEQ